MLDAPNATLTPIAARAGRVFLSADGALVEVEGARARAIALEPANLSSLGLLKHPILERGIERILHGWRSIPGVVGRCPYNLSVSVEREELSVRTLRVEVAEMGVATGQYESRVTLPEIISRWVEKNTPLLMLLPSLAIPVAIAVAILRRKL